jgi:glutamate--cysteine ligase
MNGTAPCWLAACAASSGRPCAWTAPAIWRTRRIRGLGSALTHPQITTDYAETLLEFITPAEKDIADTVAKLDGIHRYAYSKLGDELLWSQSMPCQLPAEKTSRSRGTALQLGMLKHVYRRGLALRYGKAMQCIAGIHYNYSLDERLWRVLAEHEASSKPCRRSFQSGAYPPPSATSAATAGC